MNFAPLDFDHGKNPPDTNEVIMKLLWGGAGSGSGKGVTMLPLLEVDEELFRNIRSETEEILALPGQELDGSHPTVKYVGDQDKSWKPKPGGVRQYSLYNSKDDFLYNEDDHHWSKAERRFNSRLAHIPEFMRRYFQESELQNCRLNSLTKDGGLGQHREKIIGIPGRESHYKLRFHLPVVTNPKVVFFMDGQEHRMEAGKVYLFNQSCMHGVNNAGEALRAHLVWDCYLNGFIVRDLIMPALAG